MCVAKILLEEKLAQFFLGRITKLGANGIHSLEGANGTRKKICGYRCGQDFLKDVGSLRVLRFPPTKRSA
jgi:hypothetical protein